MTYYLKKSEEEEENNKLFALIHFLLNSEKYSDIKSNYKIETSYINVLLYGYLYCLNELAEEYEKDEYIYSSLYNESKIVLFKRKINFIQDSDTKDKPYYELYNNIENNFKKSQMKAVI